MVFLRFLFKSLGFLHSQVRELLHFGLVETVDDGVLLLRDKDLFHLLI